MSEKRNDAGFTLVELMVVIVILGLLITIVALNVLPAQDRAMVDKAKADIATLDSAVELYKLHTGVYPVSSDGLSALLSAPASLPQPALYQRGGYIKKLPKDHGAAIMCSSVRVRMARMTSFRLVPMACRAARVRMPTSATIKRDGGFTLVELMATIAILAVATAAVVLSWSGGSDQTRTEAVRFAARVSLARDLAVTNVRPVGLTLDQRGYRFDQRVNGVWRPIEKSGVWGDGIQIVSDGGSERLVFDPVGLADHDQKIVLTKGDQRTQIVIVANGGVNVTP